MNTPNALLKFVAKAVLNAIGGGVVGDFVVEVLPTVANDVWEWWGRKRSPAERRAELEALAKAPQDEVQQAVAAAVAEGFPDKPPEVRRALESYLSQIPAVLRQSMRRPADPTGTTVPPNFTFGRAEDLLQFLPSKPPRFKPGDRPLAPAPWELVELLGVGGFGEVWKAKHTFLVSRKPVALKFCLNKTAADALRNEADLLDRVMVQGEQFGFVPLLQTYMDADPPCLEYEYIAGCDLAALIREWQRTRGGAPARQAASLVLDLANFIGFAHRLDPAVVHRDLKPANILVERSQGKVTFRIADFGIGGLASKQAVEQSLLRTSRGLILCTAVRGAYTPLYCSPQQMRGEAPDPRDDVHALGVIWYQLLTGDLTAGAQADWRDELEDQQVPEEMVQLLGTCLAARAERRPADGAALAEQLEALLGRQPSVQLAEREKSKPLGEDRYGKVLADLQQALARLKPGQKTYDEIVACRVPILKEYGRIFSPEHIPGITKEEFTSFLYFKNNRHWNGLYRQGLKAASNMANLRQALEILLDESKPIRQRFPQALDMVTGMGKGLATAILTVAYPEQYGVWNNTSEAALREVGLWENLSRGEGVGGRYEWLNKLLSQLIRDLNTNFWTLDALWWFLLEEA
jgi:serine/threonine protein kinase